MSLKPSMPKTLALAALSSFVLACPAWSQTTSCTASTSGVAFGSYDPFSGTPLNAVGSISVSCNVSASYTLALSTGQGSFTNRSMLNGSHAMNYNLYTDSLHTQVWGDGTGATHTVAGSGTTGSYSVYGQLPALQNAYVGSYSDSVVVTVTF